MSRAGRPITIGTRGSALALAQTEIVCAALRRAHPDLSFRVERITTTGDVRTDVPLSQLDRGMFVTEIETALRDGRIDLAVHSAKDLPSTTAADLTLAAFLPRADARDVLVAHAGHMTLRRLPPGARVGTSSPRRMCQLRALRPDVDARDVRGNVDTRIRKLHAGEYDALLLAGAGLVRLGREHEASEWLDLDLFIPCVGQGALAVETRAADAALIELVRPLDHAGTRIAVRAERAFLAELGAGCRAAAAAHARLDADGALHVTAMIGALSGEHVRATRVGDAVRAEELGSAAARELLRSGGAGFLAPNDSAIRGATIAVTRATEQAEELIALIRASGGAAVSSPAIAIERVEDTRDLDATLRELDSMQWIAFTSVNAVTAVADRLHALRLTVPASLRLAAVGRATASELLARIRSADFVPRVASGQTLADELPNVSGRRILFPRGDLATDAVATTLRSRGADVVDVVAYRTVRADGVREVATRTARREIDAIVFTSPSSVRFVSDALHDAGLPVSERPIAVTIGPSTTRAANAAHWPRITQANTPTIGALLDALHRALSDRRREAALPTH